MRCVVSCNRKRQIFRIIISGQTIFSFCHIEGITLGGGEEIEIAEGASGMGINKIGEVGDKASKINIHSLPYTRF